MQQDQTNEQAEPNIGIVFLSPGGKALAGIEFPPDVIVLRQYVVVVDSVEDVDRILPTPDVLIRFEQTQEGTVATLTPIDPDSENDSPEEGA